MPTNHQALVKWIEDSFTDELQNLFEEKLGYNNKHHLAKTIIKFSPFVQKQMKQETQSDLTFEGNRQYRGNRQNRGDG